MQTIITALIVVAAALYSLWRLAPGGVRTALHRWLIRRPDPLSQRLALLSPEPGSHCSDCGARSRCPAQGGASGRSGPRPS